MKKCVISGIVEMFGNGIYVWSAKLIAMCTIIAYVLGGDNLTSQKVFTLIALLEVVRYSFYYSMHKSILYLSQAYFSSQRIEVKPTKCQNQCYSMFHRLFLKILHDIFFVPGIFIVRKENRITKQSFLSLFRWSNYNERIYNGMDLTRR